MLSTDDGAGNVTLRATNRDSATTENVYSAINLYIPPLLIIIGVVCNILIITIMRTRHFRSLSFSVYLTSAAVNDLVGLLVALLPHWLYVNFPYIYLRTYSTHGMCKFFNFYGWGNTDFGILITTAMIAERATAVVFPLKSASICTKKRARNIVGIIIVSVVIKEFHFFFSSDIVEKERTERLCDVFVSEEAYRTFWIDVWPWIHLFCVSVCFIIILASNSVIIHQVRNSIAENTTGVKRSRLLAPMLITESVIIILLTFPFTIHLTGTSLKLRYNPDLYKDSTITEYEKIIFTVTFYMLYSCKCANFFIYYATGSSFRQGLSLVISMCFSRKTLCTDTLRSAINIIPVSTSNTRQVTFQTYV